MKHVGFEWDEQSKAGINFRRHGVRMPEAIPVLDDPYALTITDDESDPSERRFVTIGMGAAGRLLVVVYSYRGENIRLSLYVSPNLMNAKSTRQANERSVRFQQGQAAPGSSSRSGV